MKLDFGIVCVSCLYQGNINLRVGVIGSLDDIVVLMKNLNR